MAYVSCCICEAYSVYMYTLVILRLRTLHKCVSDGQHDCGLCICVWYQRGMRTCSSDAEAEDAARTGTTDVMDASVLLHEVYTLSW